MSDHVHMMLSIPPKYAVSQVVGSPATLSARMAQGCVCCAKTPLHELRTVGPKGAGIACWRVSTLIQCGEDGQVYRLARVVTRRLARVPRSGADNGRSGTAEAIYVLHSFQKSSRKTSKSDVATAGARYRAVVRERMGSR